MPLNFAIVIPLLKKKILSFPFHNLEKLPTHLLPLNLQRKKELLFMESVMWLDLPLLAKPMQESSHMRGLK